jgi:glucosylceramidase
MMHCVDIPFVKPAPGAATSELASNFYFAEVFETSAAGNTCTKLNDELHSNSPLTHVVHIFPDVQFQEITGFGGSFTEASAWLLSRLSTENRQKILEAYFGTSGARYSLTRTHINSCDFSLGHYSYAPVERDVALEHFSIDRDRHHLIPLIKDAMAISEDGFKIIASPWTAPPWMKDNQDWKGGKLLPEYYPVWATYFFRYLSAYAEEGIAIWGVTVENEPLGNDCNWESMHFTPQEMNSFVSQHLGPRLRAEYAAVKIFGFDQNRDEALYEWVDAMYDDPDIGKYFDGTAVHWYASTVESFPEALAFARAKAPGKHLINTEACVDAQVPAWKDDLWYWSEAATDWGYYWAPEDRKHLHPKYAPVFRYAADMIACLNNGVDGWIDWNMVLNRQGGPNWFGNWCTAPIIVDEATDEVYFTPLYYTMTHFSRFIRPGARRVAYQAKGEGLLVTAAANPDGTVAVVLFNATMSPYSVQIELSGFSKKVCLDSRAIQTVIFYQNDINKR